MRNPFQIPDAPDYQTERPQSRLKLTKQISDSHCGPAVLEMLFSHLDIHADQEQITEAAGARHRIKEHGLRIDQLAKATANLAPRAQFWYKEHAEIEDIDTLIHEYNYPIGVEWQNLFYETEEAEYEDTEGAYYDFGHYSIVKDIHLGNDEIVMIDPYHAFAGRDRYFSLQFFEHRWWDVNQIDINGLVRYKRDTRVMFIVTPKGMYFPKMIGMKPLP
ncbi:MAG TPA: hypothetical protein VLH19_00575 [Patescibacteria group bacterium]|nr:hypothetical protein [Patescibacteria group bacterium]